MKKFNNIVCLLAIACLMAAGGFLVHEELWVKLIGYGLSVAGGVCVSYLAATIDDLSDVIEWLKKNK